MAAQGRKISNITLTKAFHFRYLGLWTIVSIGLVVALNVVLYLLIEEHFGGIDSLGNEFHNEYLQLKDVLVTALAVETLLFSVGLVALAIATSHRIAGPFIRLERAFDAVRGGELDHELRFRKYDHLGNLADSFNSMMKSVLEQQSDTEGPA